MLELHHTAYIYAIHSYRFGRHNGVFVATDSRGRSDHRGYRILSLSFVDTGGFFSIQCVETREIMMFRFPFCDNTYRRLHNTVPDVINIDITPELVNSPFENALPALE